MDSSHISLEEQKLLGESKYRAYTQNIDKALKNFEYSSEWADLISALGKLNKAISSNAQYQIIPRRIKISKRLAQCMHPALPSGVHLKALETYDIIFSKTGTNRLAMELFIYSAGLFPLLGYAAMNVRPALLDIYEKYFIPLGEKLRPALSGFLSGVLPGYESGLDHFERTNFILTEVCRTVNPLYFYTCLWECVATNASIRLHAISFLLDHFNKRLGMQEQMYIMGCNKDVMITGICACLNDAVILVQRNTLEFILLGFPMHTEFINKIEQINLVRNALNTILRRDMSLNRRLYSWLLGSEVINSSNKLYPKTDEKTPLTTEQYFETYSRATLIKALKCTLKQSINQTDSVDLRPYKILVSLLDKVEIGPVILDHVLCDVIRTMTHSCDNDDVKKQAILLFTTFEASYIWNYMTMLFENACKTLRETRGKPRRAVSKSFDYENFKPDVDSGAPDLCEVCFLTQFLLETISPAINSETTRIFLPKVFLAIIQILTIYQQHLSTEEVTSSLRLCEKIVSKVQPVITTPVKTKPRTNAHDETSDIYQILVNGSTEVVTNLEKSKSDSKLNQSSLDDEPIRRSNSNQNMIKKSPKKNKKSKSYSKLMELDKEIISDSTLGVPSTDSSPDLVSGKKSKMFRTSPKLKNKENDRPSSEEFKGESSDQNHSSLDTANSLESQPKSIDLGHGDMKHQNEIGQQEYTIFEQCIKQYEIFYTIYVARNVLLIKSDSESKNKPSSVNVAINTVDFNADINSLRDTIIEDDNVNRISDINNMFHTLKLNYKSRTDVLHSLLNKTILNDETISDLSDSDYKDCLSSTEMLNNIYDNQVILNSAQHENIEKNINRLNSNYIDESLRNSVKLASNLLVIMSTFPKCNENNHKDNIDQNIPDWLKVLTLIACYMRYDKELQLSSVSTLFELISLLKTSKEHKPNPGVTYVSMMPPLTDGHVNYLESNTRVFQILTSILWNYLGDGNTDAVTICQLLYQLHNCLDSELVEEIIGHRVLNTHLEWQLINDGSDNNEHQNHINLERRKIDRINRHKAHRLSEMKVMCSLPNYMRMDCDEQLTLSHTRNFRKFELLWYYGKDDQSYKSFDRTLLKIFDTISLSMNISYHISIKTFATKWIQESIQRDDLNRLIKPLLLVALAPNTKRIGVIHLNLVKREGVMNEDDKAEGKKNTTENDVYAISSEGGNIKIHREPNFSTGGNKKKSPIRSLPKKLFGVTLSNKNRPSNYVSSKSVSPCLETSSNISLIVNPLDDSDIEANKQETRSLPTEEVSNQPISSEAADDNTSMDNQSASSSSDSCVSEPNLSDIKRFSGNCDHVDEVLSKHDKTKNRKTYKVTTKSSPVIDKLANSFSDVLIGSVENECEESAPADEYFGNGSSEDVESYLNNILDAVLDKYLTDDESNDNNTDDGNTIKNGDTSDEVNDHLDEMRDHTFNPSDISKRLSCASKQSVDSANNSISLKDDSPSLNDSDDDLTEENTHEEGGDSISIDSTRKQDDKKIPWDDATIEKGKQNVEILRQTVGNDSVKLKQKNMRDRVHPFHTHILLYYGVFGTKQVLYSLQTLKNIIQCDSRTFLFYAMKTSVPTGPIKDLLARHKKCIGGKNFTGPLNNTDYNYSYRGCMYLEALITTCLYYARSYFQKEVSSDYYKLPTSDDIVGNSKIQLASIELLTIIANELISIVKDIGKNGATYVNDLMMKCKLQKVILHCLISSVHSFVIYNRNTLTEDILTFNDPGDDRLHAEALQIQLLRLFLAVIKLEYEVTSQCNEEEKGITVDNESYSEFESDSPVNPKYISNSTIGQQPLFLTAILNALQAPRLRHLHRNWTDLVTQSLSSLSLSGLSKIVISVIYQICTNIDKLTKDKSLLVNLPPDYVLNQLEALTVLCHYCLLDSSQQTLLFNHTSQHWSITNSLSNAGQRLNNLMHGFLSSTRSESNTKNLKQLAVRMALLNHMPRITSTVTNLWDTDIDTNGGVNANIMNRQIKSQLLEFLSPISLHHGVNFLTSVAVTWQERGDLNRKDVQRTPSLSSDVQLPGLPMACESQMSVVKLVSSIRVMPMDSFVQTLHQVVKTPSPVYKYQMGLNIEVNALEMFYFYMKNISGPQLTDAWTPLLALLRDGTNFSPPAQFVLLALLNDFVQRCPVIPFQDRRDLRDLHDITTRLVESMSNIAGACLEQTTWLRRNLAVKEDVHPLEAGDRSSREFGNIFGGNQLYSVQAQTVLASLLAPLLDVAFGSQEKDKVTSIITTLMYNITPYLKNHTTRNIPSFYACSNLIASISGYQYTRKAWRKDMLDLLLDPAFFQMDSSCLPFWKTILDNLMTYDNTTFRELMSRVSMTQTGGLNLFSSREQEFEQRALLLKRLAFVIFCSELDQYHKYMPEIQEQLANSLRLPSVFPSVQAAVLLCFRVLLLRMSPDHVTSLWPTIISEMVQVFLMMEHELRDDNEESSNQLKLLYGMDAPWLSSTNGVVPSSHITQWRMVQLEAAKLLELGCVLPATNLPHFQMYRWAFVGINTNVSSTFINGIDDHDNYLMNNSTFVPHVKRIVKLMSKRYPPEPVTAATPQPSIRSGNLMLTFHSITSLKDLKEFFTSLGSLWHQTSLNNDFKFDMKTCLTDIESVLANDFLEHMNTQIPMR